MNCVYLVMEAYDDQKRIQEAYESRDDAEDAIDDYAEKMGFEEMVEKHNPDPINRGVYSQCAYFPAGYIGYWAERVTVVPEGDGNE
ncbi:hypothetical protein [Halorussus salinisoli]|uniref:hypothetical protein n=1 Tax=Halorussus salinisoli TaxID=2558242 RepID=UPI0010C1CE18|nr:hypothetical protein [Halorussus salinisoli]